MKNHLKEHYETLGLNPNSDYSKDEIKGAYRKCAMKTHPDKNPGDPLAEELFKRINRAYEALTREEPEFDFPAARPSATQAWDGSTGLVRQKTLEEITMELKNKIEQRMHTIMQVKLELNDQARKLETLLQNIVTASKSLALSDSIRRQYNALLRIKNARPRMIELIDQKLKALKNGELYATLSDEGDISLKGTAMNFFYASKDLKNFIFEIEKVIPGAAGGLQRLIHDTRSELERLEREKPKLLQEPGYG